MLQIAIVMGPPQLNAIPFTRPHHFLPISLDTFMALANSKLYFAFNICIPLSPTKKCYFSGNPFHCEQIFVADFYISDFQSGLRALVKASYGSKVPPPNIRGRSYFDM
ncbi:hypothetical protein V6N13_059215 [Hibiscus sabdariffa]